MRSLPPPEAGRWNVRSPLPRPSTGHVIVEGKHRRWVNALATSRGAAGVRLADFIREYWATVGFRIVHRYRGGYLESGPDYSVLRLSLVALSPDLQRDRERLGVVARVMAQSSHPQVRQWSDYVFQRGCQRLTGDSLDKRYINIFGGTRDCRAIQVAAADLTRAGFVLATILTSSQGHSSGRHMGRS